MLKKILFVFLALLLLVLVYSFAIIHQASSYTDEVILPDLEQGQWRMHQANTQPLLDTLSNISEVRRNWLLQVQDPGFHEHQGVDWHTPGAGLTTLTQSIVKKLYFTNFEPGLAKFKQTLIARFVVDARLSKAQQLQLFTNMVYLGAVNGEAIYGLDQGAQVYFKQSLSDLSDDEYLALLAMIIGPNQFHLIDKPNKNQQRVMRIKALVSGQYQPAGLMDVYYDQ